MSSPELQELLTPDALETLRAIYRLYIPQGRVEAESERADFAEAMLDGTFENDLAIKRRGRWRYYPVRTGEPVRMVGEAEL